LGKGEEKRGQAGKGGGRRLCAGASKLISPFFQKTKTQKKRPGEPGRWGAAPGGGQEKVVENGARAAWGGKPGPDWGPKGPAGPGGIGAGKKFTRGNKKNTGSIINFGPQWPVFLNENRPAGQAPTQGGARRRTEMYHVAGCSPRRAAGRT